MSFDGLLPIFSHNQSGSAESVLAGHTENPEGALKLKRQTNLSPAKGLLLWENWATVPLSDIPLLDTVRPHRRLDGVGPNLFATLTQSLTAIFSHRHYVGIRNSEASFPLHVGSDQPDPEH